MKAVYKVTGGLFVFLLLSLFTSCSNAEKTSELSFPAAPEPINFFESVLELEKEYDMISALTLQEEYSKETEVVKCRIQNEHAGFGFYYCTRPYIEQKEGDRWVNVALRDEYLPSSDDWVLCAVPDKPETVFSSVMSFRLSAVKEPLQSGRYRLRIGLLYGECTAEFTVR